jgi:hypothetical protein
LDGRGVEAEPNVDSQILKVPLPSSTESRLNLRLELRAFFVEVNRTTPSPTRDKRCGHLAASGTAAHHMHRLSLRTGVKTCNS